MQKDTVSVSLDFEHFLTLLFGKKLYHGFVGIKELNILSLRNKHDYKQLLPSGRDLSFKWWHDFQQDADRFIQWFKDNYRDVYVDVF